MKIKLFLCTLIVFSLTLFGQNSLSIPDIEARAGEEVKIRIALNNAQSVVGVQFYLVLSANFGTVKESEIVLTDRKQDHALFVKKENTNAFSFMIMSLTNKIINDNNGIILEIPVEISSSKKVGEEIKLFFSNIILSSQNAQNISSGTDITGKITIIDPLSPDLAVTQVNSDKNVLAPESDFMAVWEVKNVGGKKASGGWTESVYLVSNTTGKEYYLGNTSYDGDLSPNETISRSLSYTLPKVIGMEGDVSIKVKVKANSSVGEFSKNLNNNTLSSTTPITLEKRLYFSLSREKIRENSAGFYVLLTQSGDTTTDKTYQVSSSIEGQLNLPSTTTIEKGSSSTRFNIIPINNDIADGNREIIVKISGNGYPEISGIVEITDDEVPEIILIPSQTAATEEDEIIFTASTNLLIHEDIKINLTTSNSTRWTVPAEVIIPAGSNTIDFTVSVKNTQKAESRIMAMVRGTAEGHKAGSADVELYSSNIPTFEFTVSPTKISEGDGMYATYATIKRITKPGIAVSLKFTADIANTLILPGKVDFPANTNEVRINIGAVDNSIVDGERKVKVKAWVYLPSCNCAETVQNEEELTQEITVLDNDGPTLSVKVTPSTIKAGIEDAAKAVISRNTIDVSEPVTIKLFTDAPTIVTLPDEVVIPIGSASVEVPVTTRIDTDKKGDQTVRIQAEADKYSSGFMWLLVTDQNKPDAIIEKVTAPAESSGNERITVVLSVKNQGFATLSKDTSVDYFISETESTTGAVSIGSYILNQVVSPESELSVQHQILLPEMAGEYFLIAVINKDKQVTELSYTNNQNYTKIKLSSNYTATASTDKNKYKPGESVLISGTTHNSSNSPVGNKDVEIILKNGEYTRTFTTKTNAQGQYTYTFQPLQGESGNYAVGADYPGIKSEAQTTFDILGVEWVNKPKDYLKWELVEGQNYQGEFRLKNNTQTYLSNIQIELPAGTEFSVTTEALTLSPGQEGTLKYTVIPDGPSSAQKFFEINANFISEEGAKTAFTGWYYCQPHSAVLVADPVSINTTMIKGTTRNYEFKIANTGSTEAKNVKIELPNLNWIKLKSPALIETIAPYDTIQVVLELKPTDLQQLNVPLSGSLAVNWTGGKGLSIPFKIETVSEATGSLQIDAVDEYTYYTEAAPHISGAKVVLRHPFSGVVVAEGITDENGLFTTGNIPEGYYSLTVSADKHEGYHNNVLVDPGRVTKERVFMSYQAVSYEWNVEPTEIEDEYETDLVVKFETNIPKPVLVIDIDDPVLNLDYGESRISYTTLTNHGLIAVNKVSISIGDIEGYSITPMITDLDVLQAKSSVVIPVLIKRLTNNYTKNLKTTSEYTICQAVYIARGTYICETEQAVSSFSPYHTVACKKITIDDNISCSDPNNCSGGNGRGGIIVAPGLDKLILALPNICDADPCTISAASLALSEYGGGIGGLISCLLGLAMMDYSVYSQTQAVMACIPGPIGRIAGVTAVIKDCYIPMLQSKKIKVQSNDYIYTIFDDLIKVGEVHDAVVNRSLAYLGNPKLLESIYFHDFMKEVGVFLDNDQPFSTSDIEKIKLSLVHTDISSEEIDNFCNRWNKTMEAWNKTILEPNEEYPDIINKNDIKNYDEIRKSVAEHAINRGFSTIAEMFEQDMQDMDKYVKGKESSTSVCATVTVKFSQKMTMTREAFEGTLTINNGSDSNEIKEIHLDLIVKDMEGNDYTHLFQINKGEFLNGAGTVEAGKSGTGTVLFIPTKEAAPTIAKSYSFGGYLSYLDPATGEKMTIELYPVTLEVNPSPDLALHYFMQRNILGDDPLTKDIVEPMVPAEMSLLIKNEGYGIAKNVKVESMQPEIIENDKGLLINFEMIGSNFNNLPKQMGLLNVNFGSIEPQKSAVGQWWFTSTLLGHFVEYELNVNHLSSYGNKNLSLIKSYEVHELIKSVKAYGTGHDDIADFLVNDIVDLNDTPDRIYYSNGDSEEVSQVTSASVLNRISSSAPTTELTLAPSLIGWNYGNLDDPGTDKYKLVKVVRKSDNLELPIENFWQTHVTLRSGADPKYENKLHFVDKVSMPATYILYYTPIETNVPKVESLAITPEISAIATQPVKYIEIKFNKPIDSESLTYEDIQLIYQGNYISTEKIVIGKIDDSSYLIDVSELTGVSGYFELTVQCAEIKDLLGNYGIQGRSISWIQALEELGIVEFTTDQANTQPVNNIKISFNKAVNPAELTPDKFTLNGQPIPNISILSNSEEASRRSVSRITIQAEETGSSYILSGLAEYNSEDGEYELAVNVPEISAEDGSPGLITQTYNWKVDTALPQINKFIPQYQGAVNSQNVTDMQIVLNKPLANEFNSEWVILYKENNEQNAVLTVSKLDELHYLISGLGVHTQGEGSYKLSVDESHFTDSSGNYGKGKKDTLWIVSFEKPLAPTAMRITPDRGISSSDNITSGSDLAISLETISDKLTIKLFLITQTGESLIKEIYMENAGSLSIPISGYSGKNIFKAVAYDCYENASSSVSIETYIDAINLSSTMTPVKKQESGCEELDYLLINFTEDISELPKNAIIIKSGGISVSNESLDIIQNSNQEFKINNIQDLASSGDISIEIDLSSLTKKLSGLQGYGNVSQYLGNVGYYSVEIEGSRTVSMNNSAIYIATSNMLNYKWTVIGGEIIDEQGERISIYWKEMGEQVITLEYTTPDQCIQTISTVVKVDSSLSMEEINSSARNKLIITPIPNNGKFSLISQEIDGIFNLTVFNINGKMVYAENNVSILKNSIKQINTYLPVGVYYLVAQGVNGKYKIKFLVEM